MIPISSLFRLETSLFSDNRRDEDHVLPISPDSDTNVNDLFLDGAGENKPSFVVMKFGGTSVAKHLSNIVETIVPSQHIKNKRIPILVCSAQSYTSKSEGTTQCLLDAIETAIRRPPLNFDAKLPEGTKKEERTPYVMTFTPPPTPPQAESPTSLTHILPSLATDYTCPTAASPSAIIDGIYERHCVGARRLLVQDTCGDNFSSRGPILNQLEKELREDCDRVVRLLSAVQVSTSNPNTETVANSVNLVQMLGEISSHIRDKIVSVGELMSCRTVVAALQSRKISARLVDLTDLDTQSIQANDRTSLEPFVTAIRNKLISSSLPTDGGCKPVIVATGFFGRVPGSLLDFIGRGYTDVCAAICARAVAAEELQIWKEASYVDGVFSADPRKIKSAQLLPEITSVQAKLLTAYGSEVIHHRAIDQAICAGIPILVKNVVNPTGAGTRVETCTGAVPELHTKSHASSTPPAIVTAPVFAVTVLNDLELVDVRFDNWELTPDVHPLGIVLDVVKRDKHSKIGMDLITTSQDEVGFVVSDSNSRDDEKTFKNFEELKRVASVTISRNMSYVQVVFDHKNQTYILLEIMKALSSAQIEVEKISHRRRGDGVGFVVKTSLALRAGEIVHDALLDLQK
ncbi:hypothetical protein H0H87_008538 [Tephrocybe sp. NHM501043]|nr:hypothetical protein H0H87_008538 [Tephrocybe sp. NHM501043]